MSCVADEPSGRPPDSALASGLRGAMLPPGLLILGSLGLWAVCRPSASSAGDEPAQPPRRVLSRVPPSRTPEAQPGGRLYRQHCARCHGLDGTGGPARGSRTQIPDFTNHRWQSSRTDAQLRDSILDGKGSQMPPFREKFVEQEAQNLVAHIRAFDAAPAAAPPAARRGEARDDFEDQFRRLDEELQELKREFRELSAPPRKP